MAVLNQMSVPGPNPVARAWTSLIGSCPVTCFTLEPVMGSVHTMWSRVGQECTRENQKLWLKTVGWILGSQSTRLGTEGALVIKPEQETETYQVIWSFPQVPQGSGTQWKKKHPSYV